ncbi:MAG: hypothetical protein HDR26_08475 [Lachnospiraceae bacterium]|nr:hypothetical protein [Lachnospiraceae bacterium]
MNLIRIFSADKYKGMKNYLNSQKKYEILRTILYFTISLSLFAAGYITTKSKLNLLTIVAVLGCLPACKSVVGMIMFLRFRSFPEQLAEEIEKHSQGLDTLYDMVFTTYEKNYHISHIALRGNTVVCYTCQEKMDENACIRHLSDTLALDGTKNISFKIFRDLDKYTARLDQLRELEDDKTLNAAVKKTLLSIAL